MKAFKEKIACNGAVIEHPEYGEVIQLQGDQRKNICQFLVEVSISRESLKLLFGLLLLFLHFKMGIGLDRFMMDRSN